MPKKYQSRRNEEIKQRDAIRQVREPKVTPRVADPDKPEYEVPIPDQGCTVWWREEKVRREWATLHKELGLAEDALDEFILKKRRLRPVANLKKGSPRTPNWYLPQ